MGFFKKFKEAWLASMTFDKLDDEFYEELEEALILADIGASTAADTVVQLRKRVSQKLLTRADEVKDALRDILAEKLDVGDTALHVDTQPSVVLIIGVNGVGKTTSIGKLAARLKSEGKKVLLCAGDTFRAAAADQLEIWANRAGVDIVRQHEGADPGAVLFDALQAAKARHADVVLCDTAGRLHNKQNLMNELAKLRKIIDRETPDAAKETLLVLDAKTPRENLNFTGYTCLEYDILYRGYTGPLDVGSSVIFDNIGSYSNVLKPPFIHPDVPMIEYRKGDDSLRLIKRAQTAEEIFAQYVFEE